jgi:hypothetical protein
VATSKVSVTVLIAVIFSSVASYARTIGFSAPNTFPSGVSSPGCIAAGDFNGDGNVDIAVTDHINSVAVFLGKSDGTFSAPIIYSLDFYVLGCAAVADFNGDHKPDLAVVGGDGSGNGLALLTGNGDGTFNSPIYFATALAGASLISAVADLNNDHIPDIFIGGNGSSDELFGDGNGGFTEGQLQPVTGFSVAVGDFNGDGNLDFACTSPFTNSVAVLLGNGDGTFQSPIVYSGIFQPIGVTTGDFNNDGKLDLAVTAYSGAVVMLIGNGDGTFNTGNLYFAGAGAGTIVSADFNKDGNLDLATSNFNGGGISALSGNGDGSFPFPTMFPTGTNPSYLVAADFNQDGSPDVAVTNDTDNTVSILLNSAGTRLSLRSVRSRSKLGQRVGFVVTVVGTVTTSVIPSGNVIFHDGSITLGTLPLKRGRAEFSTSGLTQGTHDITVVYAGDAIFNPNVSNALMHTVNYK